MKKLFAIVWLVVAFTVPALAQSVEIEAGEMEILEIEQKAIFRGAVVAKRGGDVIRADSMTVTYVDVKQKDGSIKTDVDTMVCRGNISINTGDQKITGERATFFVRKDELVVAGNVKVLQGKTELRGPELSVNLRTKRTVMKGGRVKGSFVPK